MNDQAALTVEVIRARRWPCVRLGRRSKKPIGKHWEITTDAEVVARWFTMGHNVGLVCGEPAGVAVLDPDRLVEWADMVDEMEQPAPPWVITGSGKLHYYIKYLPNLPAKILWKGDLLGEIMRGPGLQQVLLPGSVHDETGRRYRWITESLGALVLPVDPVHDPLPELPLRWAIYFQHETFTRMSGGELDG